MKGSLFKALQEMPKVRVRPETPPTTLESIAEPKPEATQVEPIAIPDRIEFEPIKFRQSLERMGMGFVEIDGARYYGVSIKEALGQAVIDGAFGLLNIEIPE